MGMTGNELWLYTQALIDKDYSDWFSIPKANRLFRAAIFNVIEQKVSAMDSQKIYDELSHLIKTDVPINGIANNTIVKSVSISDYMRLLSIGVFVEANPIKGAYIDSVSGLNPTSIRFNINTPYRSGTMVKTSTITATTGETSFYLDQVSNKKFKLYKDKQLQLPASANIYTANPTVVEVFFEYCTPLVSDRKINNIARPTSFDPMYEDSDGSIVIHPRSLPCTSAMIDYVAIPTVFVDVNNMIIDLELTYPAKFLYSIANEFANIFAASTRDDGLYRSTENEIVQNP